MAREGPSAAVTLSRNLNAEWTPGTGGDRHSERVSAQRKIKPSLSEQTEQCKRKAVDEESCRCWGSGQRPRTRLRSLSRKQRKTVQVSSCSVNKLQDGKDVSGETLMPRWEKLKSHRKAKSKKRRQQRGHGSTHRDMNRNHWRKILEGKKWSGVKCSLSSHMRTEGCSTKRNIPETLKSSRMTGAEAKME